MLENKRFGNTELTFPMLAITKSGQILTEMNRFFGQELVVVVVFGDGPPSFSTQILEVDILPRLTGTASEELKSEILSVLRKFRTTRPQSPDPQPFHI